MFDMMHSVLSDLYCYPVVSVGCLMYVNLPL